MTLTGTPSYQISQRLPAGGTLSITVREGQEVPSAWREHVPEADRALFASGDVSEKQSASGDADDASASTQSTKPRRKRK